MKVYLRGLNSSDSEVIYSYRLIEESQVLTSGNKYFSSLEYVKKWVEDVIFSKTDIYLAICDVESHEVLGFLSINDIDFRNRKAQWGGILIGKKEYWGKGIGSEAAILMLEFVFEELNINTYWAFWLTDNIPSIKIGKKIGFKEVGILTESIYKGGKYNDQLIMSINKKEYDKIKSKLKVLVK
jgi:[ribosomal protein S5]-alanine N-acetyltransferase